MFMHDCAMKILIQILFIGILQPVFGQKKNVNLSKRGLKEIPEWVYAQASEVRTLKLYGNKFDSLSIGIQEFENLEKLYLGKNNLKTLPSTIGNLKHLKLLSLTGNKLDSLPQQLGELDNLNQLWLGQNNLKVLPNSMGNLSELKNLYLQYNWLDSIPATLGNCIKLEFLNLNRNNLKEIPESIGQIKSLKEIYLVNAGFLVDLPESFCNLRRLEILEIDDRVAIPPCLLVYQTNRLKIILH
jgi:Leucine-rich repeat (LRR) protein